MNKTIEELKDEKRYGTAHVYQSTLNAFCEFCGCKIVYFHQLNRATLKEFETHLRDKQLSWNTVSTYMRTLRGAYNKAVDQKITTGKPRLFNHVYTGVKNDVKRALEVEEINKRRHIAQWTYLMIPLTLAEGLLSLPSSGITSRSPASRRYHEVNVSKNRISPLLDTFQSSQTSPY